MASPSAEPASKRLRLSAPSINENEIPPSEHYQVSYAHRSVVTCTTYSPKHDMMLTASQDGIVKFWKRTCTATPAPVILASMNNSKGGAGDPTGQCVEFVKSYQAHTAPIGNLVMTLPDGDTAASVGQDNVIKFYDVGGFDVTGMIRVQQEYPCGKAAAFVGEQQSLLAVASAKQGKGVDGAGAIYIFSSVTLSPVPVKDIRLHAAPVLQMRYNFKFHCMISCDQKGVIEYWNGSILSQISSQGGANGNNSFSADTTIDDYDAIEGGDDVESRDEKKVNDATFASLGDAPLPERNGISFESKMSTDLYSLLKKKTYAISLAISPTGNHFAVYGSDRKVRLFEFQTGKSIVQYDERMKVYDKQVAKRQASGVASDGGMDAIDYGNRAAREREMGDTTILNMTSKVSYQECGNQSLHIQFDPTGRYLVLPTVIGIKVIDWVANKCRKVIGKGDASTLRFLGGVMIMGDAKVDRQMHLARTAGMGSTTNSSDKKTAKISDSVLIAMAFNKRRFYVFSHLDPIAEANEKGDSEEQQKAIISRDVLNEPPDSDDLMLDNINGNDAKEAKLGKEAILRTTMGDIHIRLFPEETPRTVENFCGHARSGYYDNVIFHRIIKSFMLQTGDPLGDGTGGESVWGGEFEDEFVRE